MELFGVLVFVINIGNVLAGFQELSEKNLIIVKNLVNHYGITNSYFYIVSENPFEIDHYIKSFLRFKRLTTFNIHTRKIKSLRPIVDLFVIIPNSTESFEAMIKWEHITSMIKSKFVIAILSRDIRLDIIILLVMNANILFIIEGKPIKCNVMEKVFDEIQFAEQFILTDRYEAPERHWPIIKIEYHAFPHREANFPLVIDLENKKSGLLAYYAKIFEEYYNNRMIAAVGDKLEDHKSDVFQLYAQVVNQLDGYPIKMSKVCFILPVVDEIFPEDFLKKPFHLSIWIAILIAIIYFTISMRLLVSLDYFTCFFESLTITFGSLYKGVNNKFLYIQFFLYGFIIWNIYSAKLSSYLTTPNLGRNLETPEDVKNTNITLWADFNRSITRNLTDYLKENYPNVFHYQQNIFKKQFNPHVVKPVFYKHLYDFDVSHGYLANDVIWSFISKTQSLLRRKVFSFSEMCPYYGHIYPLTANSRLIFTDEIFTPFTLRILEGGLDIIWETFSYLDIHFKFKTELDDIDFTVLGFRYFEVTWWILLFGLTMSVFVFCIEISFFFFKNKKR